jgi:hypothetical protein
MTDRHGYFSGTENELLVGVDILIYTSLFMKVKNALDWLPTVVKRAKGVERELATKSTSFEGGSKW